jgi:hypothetical protein
MLIRRFDSSSVADILPSAITTEVIIASALLNLTAPPLGGWKSPQTVLTCNQRADPVSMQQALAARRRLEA